MSYTFHEINNSNEFLHSNPVPVIKDYNLYRAIKELKDYAVSPEFDLNSSIYASLKDNLENAMVNEIDIMDSFDMILESYLGCSILIDKDDTELRYLNLYRMFNYLVKTKYIIEYASRIKLFRQVIESQTKLEIVNLNDEKSSEYVYVDSEYKYEFSLNTLQILNLQAVSTINPENLPEYILALSDEVPLEKMLKNNLFNYNTFSNTELMFYTLMPNIEDLYEKTVSLASLMYASSYFWVETDNVYETFRNYIDFSYLEGVVTFLISQFKYYLDAIDNAYITVNKDPLSYYPSGQEELYYIIAVMRKILAILAIVYNIAKMFKDQYLTKQELDLYLASLTDLLNSQLTPEAVDSKLKARFPGITDEEINGILYDGAGTAEQNSFLQEIYESSENSYEYSKDIMDSIADYVNVIQDTSKGYNSVVSDGSESGLVLDDISQKLINFMESIIDKIIDIRSILDLVKGNTLPSFSFLHTITWILDLSFLDKLSQLITSFNTFLYNFNCLLNAMACYASYIKDMFDTLKTFYNNEDKFDLTNYMLGSFSASFNGASVKVTTDMLADNQSSILSILSETLSESELARVADSLSHSIKSVNSSCISSWVDGLYSEALNSMKESIRAGQRCKINPGGRLNVDANLRINLGIDIPDLRFQFRNCTGAS